MGEWTETKKNSDKKWNEENREHRNYLSSRTSARSFVRKKAKYEDVLELINIYNNENTGEDKKIIKILEN